MISRWIFTGFVVLVALQRLIEVRVSRKHEEKLRTEGGVEYAAGQYPVMVGLHAAWLVSTIAEVFLLKRPFLPGLFIPAFILLLAGQALRYSAILTLGERWTVRVIVLPGRPLVERGIYRILRHPNYLGVGLEVLSLPLLHSAAITAVVFSILNLAFLKWRIRDEEKAILKNSINAHSHLTNFDSY